MRLRRLRLVNFRQHRETDIAFGSGLTGIIGPNGAGKSTLLEAIAWALYGMEAARGNRDSIRWARAKPRAEVRVELEFDLGAHAFRVIRTLFNAEVYLDGAEQPMATSLSEVTARLQRLLRMGCDEFFNTYFTGQKDLAAMADLRPTERRLFLNRLLGYDLLRSAQERVRGSRNGLSGELTGLKQAVPDPAALAQERDTRGRDRADAVRRLAEAEELLASARSASDGHLPVFRELREFRERYVALAADRRVAETELRQVVEDVRRLEEAHEAAARAHAEREALAAQLDAYARARAELGELESLARDAESRGRMETQLSEIARQLEELAVRRAAAAALARSGGDLAGKLEAARQALEQVEAGHSVVHAAWVREKADADATRRSLLDQYRDLEAQRERIMAAGPDGACPTCGRPLGAEYRTVIELLETQLDGVRQNGQYYRARIEQLHERPAELAALDSRHQGLMQDVERLAQELAVARRAADDAVVMDSQTRLLEERRGRLTTDAAALRPGYERARHDSVAGLVMELEPLARRAERLSAESEREPGLAAELTAAEQRRAALVDRLAALQRELDALHYDEESFLAAEKEMERLEQSWQAAERDVAVARVELKGAEDRLREAERREQEAAKRAARVVELQNEVRLLNELDRALGDLGTELNNEIGPELAAQASDFLAALTDGEFDEVQLDDEFEATVFSDGAPQPVISGGEEDLRSLVLRLAVSQMIAERSGQPLSLLVLDEIFGSLDDERRSNVVRLLRGLAARFPQVVLITHVEGVRESLDRVLRVRYDESSGASVVTEERGGPGPEGGANADVAA